MDSVRSTWTSGGHLVTGEHWQAAVGLDGDRGVSVDDDLPHQLADSDADRALQSGTAALDGQIDGSRSSGNQRRSPRSTP